MKLKIADGIDSISAELILEYLEYDTDGGPERGVHEIDLLIKALTKLKNKLASKKDDAFLELELDEFHTIRMLRTID